MIEKCIRSDKVGGEGRRAPQPPGGVLVLRSEVVGDPVQQGEKEAGRAEGMTAGEMRQTDRGQFLLSQPNVIADQLSQFRLIVLSFNQKSKINFRMCHPKK